MSDQNAEKLKQKAQKLYRKSDTHLAQAIQAYQAYLAIAPEDDEAWSDLAALYGSGSDAKALECIERAIALNPEEITYWEQKLLYLRSLYQSNFKKEQHVRLSAQEIRDLQTPEVYQIGCDLIQCFQKVIEKWEAAERDRESILDQKYWLADVFLQQDDYGSAIELLNIVFEQEEEERSRVALTLAHAYEETKNYHQALHFVDIFLEDEPEVGYLHFHKVEILRSMGDLVDADHLLTEILASIDSQIEKMAKTNQLAPYIFHQKAGLLADYQNDYQAAASCLQEIINAKLYYNESDRAKILAEIEALRQRSGN